MPLHVPLKTPGASLSAPLLWTPTPTDRLSTDTGLWFHPPTSAPTTPYGWPEGLEFSLSEEE